MKCSGFFKANWPLAILLLAHCGLQTGHLQLDFWNDEWYTLEHFVFQPFGASLRDYHSTNNHVFFSLLMQCWTSLAGPENFRLAADAPLILRLLPFVCSVIAIVACYNTALRIGGRGAACLAAVLLITTIPFWNYAAQIRGYSLSMCLAACLTLQIVRQIGKPAWSGALLIALLFALLLYTLPSNIYYAAGVLIVCAGALLFTHIKAHRQSLISICASCLAGLALAFVFYVPVQTQMQHLPIFKSGSTPIRLEALRQRLPVVLYHFLSGRYLLLPAVAFGLLLVRKTWRWGLSLILIVVLPFVFADIRANSTPYRVFLTALPLVCTAFGIAVAFLVGSMQRQHLRLGALTLAAGYCFVVFFFQAKKTERAAKTDIENGTRAGDLYFQYNLHDYHPNADAVYYLQHFASSRIPLVEACRMDEELLKYLELRGWNRGTAKQLKLGAALTNFDTVDVLVERPATLSTWLRDSQKKWQQQLLLPGVQSVQIVRLTKR